LGALLAAKFIRYIEDEWKCRWRELCAVLKHPTDDKHRIKK
jgi:hypothetical protein